MLIPVHKIKLNASSYRLLQRSGFVRVRSKPTIKIFPLQLKGYYGLNRKKLV